MEGALYALTLWDPDGPGPLRAQPVAGGTSSVNNNIVRWDGVVWRPLGGRADGTVFALTTWDPDGSGPLPERLVAGGDFFSVGGVMARGVAIWDGAAWSALGGDLTNPVRALTTWDPDGPGPMPAELVAGGEFRNAGGVEVNYIARWDGSAWRSFGSGMSYEVYSLTTWDPDGSGPLSPQLVAGGFFSSAGGVTVNKIARWDGEAWRPLGSGVNGHARAITTWDPDGAGPLAAELVAGGQFSTAGGVSVGGIARWDGAAWRGFGNGRDGSVYALSVWDPDGAGPLPGNLVAGGVFTSGVARWDGTVWRALGSGISDDGPFHSAVGALITWDPDGAGPMSAQTVAGGRFANAGGAAMNNIARWDGTSWRPFGTGMNDRVSSLTTFDPDNTGPQPAQLVAAGQFTSAGGVATNRAARWDGEAWQPFGSEANNGLAAITAWDPDGPEPGPAVLVAGGYFDFTAGTPLNRVASWDGAAWQPFAGHINGVVYALAAWDPDGPGPATPEVVVGGAFDGAGGVEANSVAHWDGAAWHAFGTVGRVPIPIRDRVNALVNWDPDGPGPLPEQLVIGGTFAADGGFGLNNIARWDGAAWRPLGSGVDGWVWALTTWDPDGPGPQTVQIVAGGSFENAGGVTVNNVARWDGAAWQPLGSGVDGPVYAFTAWDADGPGPQTAQIVVGGLFTAAGDIAANNIARWDGAAWQPMASGTNEWVSALTAWDPDGSGPMPEQPVAGGAFTIAGGLPAGYLATWSTRSPLEPICPADFNNSGSVSVQDIFDFLGAYFAADPRADINADGAVSVQDILDFLGAYFSGCE